MYIHYYDLIKFNDVNYLLYKVMPLKPLYMPAFSFRNEPWFPFHRTSNCCLSRAKSQHNKVTRQTDNFFKVYDGQFCRVQVERDYQTPLLGQLSVMILHNALAYTVKSVFSVYMKFSSGLNFVVQWTWYFWVTYTNIKFSWGVHENIEYARHERDVVPVLSHVQTCPSRPIFLRTTVAAS
jgi:hypothetical protein